MRTIGIMTRIISVFLLLAVASVITVFAQPQFIVPLTYSDGNESSTLYFGIKTGAAFCIVESDSFNGHQEYFLPPVPPGFDMRWVWPRSGSNLACFDQGSYTDIRPYTASTQKDTLKVKCQLGEGSVMILTWPHNLAARFTQLTLRFVGQTVGLVNVNMLTDTTADITDVGDPAVATILSGGLNPASVGQTSGEVPGAYALSQNYPNPFNPSTTIDFAVQQTSTTDVSVYNLLGQKVATLTSTLLTPGYYTATWDGKSGAGISVASGVYFVRMTAQGDHGANFSAMRKLLLMK